MTLPRNWSDAPDRFEPSLVIYMKDCEFSNVGSGILGNGPCIESISEDNRFSDGAIALGLFDIDIDIDYIDEDVNFTWTIMDDRGVLPMVDLDTSYGSLQDFLVLRCVDSSDPSSTSRSITLVVTLDWSNRPIMWFDSCDSDSRTIPILVPEWGEAVAMIEIGKVSEPLW